MEDLGQADDILPGLGRGDLGMVPDDGEDPPQAPRDVQILLQDGPSGGKAPPGGLGLLNGGGGELRPGEARDFEEAVGPALKLAQGGPGVLDAMEGEVEEVR